jgi:hypothetical protein
MSQLPPRLRLEHGQCVGISVVDTMRVSMAEQATRLTTKVVVKSYIYVFEGSPEAYSSA